MTKADEKQYKLVYTDEDGKSGEFTAHLLKVEGKTFLNLTPVEPILPQNDFYKGHFLATHTFALISQTAPTVQISFLEIKWLKKFLIKKPTALRHAKMEDEILLTASPKELQKFLLDHLNTEGAFAKPISLKRKSEPSAGAGGFSRQKANLKSQLRTVDFYLVSRQFSLVMKSFSCCKKEFYNEKQKSNPAD